MKTSAFLEDSETKVDELLNRNEILTFLRLYFRNNHMPLLKKFETCFNKFIDKKLNHFEKDF
jgi:hypothetical protein